MDIPCETVEYGTPRHRETMDLRNLLLRTPLGIEFTDDDWEIEKNSRHLAAYDGDQLLGCLLLIHENDETIRMRQLAVAEEHQRKGIGTALVAYAESVAVELGYTRIVMNARETAIAFYERIGYEKKGTIFVLVTIPHIVMQKIL